MIHLNNIHYRYPKREEFGLEGVSFTVEPGMIFTLLGPSGAVQTTLIRTLSGLILAQEGTVTICGHDQQLAEQKARRCLKQRLFLPPDRWRCRRHAEDGAAQAGGRREYFGLSTFPGPPRICGVRSAAGLGRRSSEDAI